MKTTGIVACVLAAAGLVVCLMFERQACLKLNAQNDALRRQLSKMGELTLENQRLSNLLGQASAQHSSSNSTANMNVAANGQLEELAELRSQIAALRRQSNDVASLRADTRAAHAALDEAREKRNARRTASQNNPGAANGGPLEILEATYGTARTNMDVSAKLNNRVRNGSLKIVASNNLTGDLDFGQVKNLTVVYRYDGVVMTNQFREGDLVVLPPEAQ